MIANENELKNEMNEYKLLIAIKNIDKQINCLKEQYQKNFTNKNGKTSYNSEFCNIQENITNLIDTIEPATSKKLQYSDLNSNDKCYEIAQNILDMVDDNNVLTISEKSGKVFLPYTSNELKLYLREFPDEYNSLTDVINQEYIITINKFKHEKSSRFREMYGLMRDVEKKSIMESFKKAVGIMFNSQIHPAIIAACKSEQQIKKYIYCVEHNKIDEFTEFKINFEVSPYKYSNFNEEYSLNTIRKKYKH